MNTSPAELIELLESRRLLTVFFTGTVAFVDGTSRPDNFVVSPSVQEGIPQLSYTITPKGGASDGTSSNLAQTTRVIVRGSATQDVLEVDPAVTVPVDFIPNDVVGATLFGNTLAIQGGKGRDIIRVYRNRGQVNDITVVFNDQETQFSSASAKALLIVGNRGEDDIAIGKINLPNAIFGGEGNDSISGGAENDYISGDAGIDTIRSGAGDDQLLGEFEPDFIDAGDGNDSITTEGGATVLGGNGDDNVYCNAGTIQFTGGEGHDEMRAPGARTDQTFTDFSPRRDSYLRIH